jgi:hypothetical protein
MLKFGMTLDGGEHGLGLILEPRNLELLSQERPMLINLADVGLGFVKRKKGRGRIFIACSESPVDVMRELARTTNIPIPNADQAVFALVEVQPEMRCYCAALNAPCVCRG